MSTNQFQTIKHNATAFKSLEENKMNWRDNKKDKQSQLQAVGGCKIIGKNDFPYHFKKIIVRYKKIGYNINVFATDGMLGC